MLPDRGERIRSLVWLINRAIPGVPLTAEASCATRSISAYLTRGMGGIKIVAWDEPGSSLPDLPPQTERGRAMFRVNARKPVHFCDGLSPGISSTLGR